MRKIALVLALVAMASFAFALDISIDSASATTTLGFNLGDFSNPDMGLLSESDFDVSLTIGEGSKTSEHADTWYGEISATGAFYGFDADHNSKGDLLMKIGEPEITAKITDGSVYILLQGAPGFNTDKVVPIFEAEFSTDTDDDIETEDAQYFDDDFGTSGSIGLGYSDDMMMIEFDYGTNNDWNDWTTAAVLHYVGLKGSYTLSDALKLEGAIAAAVDTSGLVSIEGSVMGSGTAGMVTYSVAADMDDDTDSLEVGASADFALSDDISVGVKAYAGVMPTVNSIDAKVTFDGTFGSIAESAYVSLDDIEDTDLGIEFDSKTTLTVSDEVNGSVELKYASTLDAIADGALYAQVIVNLMTIENTTFTLQYTVDDVLTISDDFGEITLAAKVAM